MVTGDHKRPDSTPRPTMVEEIDFFKSNTPFSRLPQNKYVQVDQPLGEIIFSGILEPMDRVQETDDHQQVTPSFVEHGEHSDHQEGLLDNDTDNDTDTNNNNFYNPIPTGKIKLFGVDISCSPSAVLVHENKPEGEDDIQEPAREDVIGGPADHDVQQQQQPVPEAAVAAADHDRHELNPIARRIIQEQGGSEPILLFVKLITHSDVKKRLNRIIITGRERLMGALTEHERDAFCAGIEAGGNDKEICVSLSTAFRSGPLLKLCYRPNDSGRPFGLALRTGAGDLGSPSGSPISVSAELDFVGNGRPSFRVQIKSRSGDFSVRRSVQGPLVNLSSTRSESSVIRNGVVWAISCFLVRMGC